ncbi:MAG: hypothetical protein WC531_02290 [Candidatus Paceibacterota bacterium]
MFKDFSSAILIVLILVVGGLAYLLSPNRLNSSNSNLANVNMAVSSEFSSTSTMAQTGSSTPR